MDRDCEILIAGAGITGLAIARELLRRGEGGIVIIEKEKSPGIHASGRNSGVLHAGVYYAPDTLKAKFCAEGNRLMREFCREKGLALIECGKLIVTRDESRLEGLFELKARADLCGARAFIVDERDAAQIEPYAKTCGRALFSPDTAVINPGQIVSALAREIELSGMAHILYGARFMRLKGSGRAVTSAGVIKFGKFINAAGAHADTLAHTFGVGRNFKIIPFKGSYKKLRKERDFLVRGNIYPVPDLRNPFLGIHFTRGADGSVYAGPTATPAFGREQYGGFGKPSFEALSILYRDGAMFLRNEAFRASAVDEIKKLGKRYFFEEAAGLVQGLAPEDLVETDKSGIRAQLVDWEAKRLVMDFMLIRDGGSLHVLNAISPAFTSSMAFARHAADVFLAKS
ncbi:MAG: L-2-hydroxyglutarate oxidase [Deltaproteobacteria bacterium]